ncbi:TolC family protein [Flavobacterium aciduliphilum]|uniref:Outer membrane protein n=1 Tax=Flavobacterium aciduliphilum TaxID=1101402 RepID=A0A328YF49_9FLAO|nr:TolC family protein [Flavobacterium aciduliphilum]RAR71783.1 outer membrane protein [Flavobacterium aciduliphilum]
MIRRQPLQFRFVFILFIGMTLQAQSKKWSLQECVDYALKHNISIKQSELDSETAVVGKTSAVGIFLPSLNANASHSWNIGLNQNITTGLLENQTTQFTSAGLNSNVTIYNGLQNQNKLRKANLSILAAQYQLSKMKDDISLNVANAFLQILFNKENLKVQNEQLANDERQQKKSEELVAAGSIPKGDLLDVKATVAADKQKVIAAENTLFISKLSLAQLLQLEDFKDFDVVDVAYEAKPSATMLEKPEDIVAKAKQERVELKIAQTNLNIAQKDVKIAKGAFQPSLIGFYSFSSRVSYADRIVGIDASGFPIISGPLPFFNQFSNNKGHNFGIQLNIPILNSFSAKTNLERTKIALERSKTNQKQAELDLERNVYTAITNAKVALNAYEAAQAAFDARKEAFNYAKEKYAVGMMNSFDFNQSQTLFVNAQSEVLRTKYDYIFKVKIVEFYFGIPIIENK